MGPQSGWAAYAALAAAIVAISWSAIFVRWADIPGSASAFYRVLIAACVLLPWRASHKPAGARRQAPSSRAIGMAIAAGVFFAGDLALFNTAIMRSSASTTTLLGNNAPVFVGLGTWLLLGRRPHGLFWAGLAASTLGMALMLWAGAGGAGTATVAASAADLASGGVGPTGLGAGHAGSRGMMQHDVIGDVMAIAAALCFAGYMLTVAEARASMDTLTLNAIAMAACSATLLPICLVIGAPLWGYPTGTWLALLYLGLVAQLGAYLGIAYALGHLPATVVSIGLLAQAPFTGLLAAWLLGERLSSLQLAGGALVLAGIYIVTRAGAESTPTAANRA